MKEFTIREIIEYAEQIEAESHKFYSQAATKLQDKDTVELAKELSEEEVKHFNHLREVLNDPKLSTADLDQVVGKGIDLSNRKVKTTNITETSNALDVLNVALEREINTEELYKMYLTFTDLPEHLVTVFEDLRNQEIGHQNRIKTLIKKMK